MAKVPRGKVDDAWVDVTRHATVAWWAVSVAWGLLQVVILALCFFWGGTKYQCRRWYRFLGPGSAAFERACTRGAEVTVWVPPHRPSRAVADVPFAPTMADLLP